MDDFQNTPIPPTINMKAVTSPMIHWLRTYSDGAVTIGEEVSRIAQDQTKRNLDAWTNITAQFANPTKALEAHERWVWQTVRAWTDETQRLFLISGEIVQSLTDRSAAPK